MKQPQLSKIERGITSPGTRLLQRFAVAYDEPLSSLIDPENLDATADQLSRVYVSYTRASTAVGEISDTERPEHQLNADGAEDLARYVNDPALVRRTLRTMPRGTLGVAIKLALLNAIEAAAASTRALLPAEFFLLRRSVISGEL